MKLGRNRFSRSLIATIFLTVTTYQSGFAQSLSGGTEEDPSSIYRTNLGPGDEKPPQDGRRSTQFPMGEQPYGGLTYQVHVLGEVKKPGTFRLPPSSRLSEALEKAENVLDRGSLRSIELRRKGQSRSIDLLSFKLFGNLNANPYLLDNDVLIVPLKGRVAEIQGTVKRPGLYEILSEKNLDDFVRLAGGFTPGLATDEPLSVIRYKNGEKKVLEVQNTKEGRVKFPIENGDFVSVPHFLLKKNKFDFNLSKIPGDANLFYPSYSSQVFVLGGVNRPGAYPFNTYYDLRQYLTAAGGTNKMAIPQDIKLYSVEGDVSKWTKKSVINPGDAIVVPEKYLPPEAWVGIILGITTSILGITTTVLTLTR